MQRKMRPGVFRRRQRERRGPLADSRRRRGAVVHEQGEARAPEDEGAGEGKVWQPTGGTGRGMAWRPSWAKPTGAWRGGERRCRRRSIYWSIAERRRRRSERKPFCAEPNTDGELRS